MLIECNNCGAPLDVKGKESLVKCAYCGVQTQLAQARTVAASTPTGWRPPTEWRPPEGARAGQAQVFAYHRPLRILPILISTVMLLTVLGGAAGVLVVRQATRVQADTAAAISKTLLGSNGAQGALEQAREAIEQAARGVNQATALGLDNFGPGGAVVALTSYKAALQTDSLSAERLVLYPTYAILSARDPKNSKHFDRYTLRGGVVGAAEPLANAQVGKDIEKRLFDPDKTALAKLPALIKQTVDTLKYEDAKVSHVLVESGLPFTKGIVIRVYVSGPRESGRIDFNADGSVNRIYK